MNLLLILTLRDPGKKNISYSIQSMSGQDSTVSCWIEQPYNNLHHQMTTVMQRIFCLFLENIMLFPLTARKLNFFSKNSKAFSWKEKFHICICFRSIFKVIPSYTCLWMHDCVLKKMLKKYKYHIYYYFKNVGKNADFTQSFVDEIK